MSASPTSMSAAAVEYQDSHEKYQPRRSSSTHTSDAVHAALNAATPGAASTASPPVIIDIKEEQQSEQIPARSQLAAESNISTPATVTIPTLYASTSAPLGNGTSDNKVTDSAIPTVAAEHGAPFRRYINGKVTPSLLEGMKELGVKQPEKPLQWLGEFLLSKSRQLEGS